MRAVILVLALVSPGAFQEPSPRRQRPPQAIQCQRDHLTSYTGKVVRYSRAETRLRIDIRTDWDTAEQFTIHLGKGEDAAGRFLLRSGAFQPRDWDVIESSKGRLRPGMRATVWECNAGGAPVLTIDWEPPPARKNGR